MTRCFLNMFIVNQTVFRMIAVQLFHQTMQPSGVRNLYQGTLFWKILSKNLLFNTLWQTPSNKILKPSVIMNKIKVKFVDAEEPWNPLNEMQNQSQRMEDGVYVTPHTPTPTHPPSHVKECSLPPAKSTEHRGRFSPEGEPERIPDNGAPVRRGRGCVLHLTPLNRGGGGGGC